MPILRASGPDGVSVDFPVSSYQTDTENYTGNPDTILAMGIAINGVSTVIVYIPSSGFTRETLQGFALTSWNAFRFIVSKHPAMRALNLLMGANNGIDLYQSLERGPHRKEGYYFPDDMQFKNPVFIGKIFASGLISD